ncbi:AraC family transcriptional regulator [Paenibacillus terrigena]|uniref:AraC family transcriptional regulator n=1 Tax=Paenibacillus terrigena TaxID=369333 RepID=UPI00036B5CDB|nr:AraC family transcriptional regulator [Paenibacillus terrigena]
MLDQLPSLSPEETLPLLRNQFYYPPYITLARMFKSPKSWFMAPQGFKQYQLLYGVAGMAENIVDGNTYVMRKGDVYLIPPNAILSQHPCPADPFTGITVTFHFGRWESPLETILGRGPYLGNDENGSLHGMFISLIHAIKKHHLSSNMLAQGLLLQIIYQFAQNRPALEAPTASTTKVNAKMVQICNYMKENYRQAIRLDTLSAITGLSRNYIIRQFRKCYGSTPADYLASIRIEKAKQLAIQTDLTITEIANLVGYADLHSFSRMFKKRMQMSLSQFNATVISSLDLESPVEKS